MTVFRLQSVSAWRRQLLWQLLPVFFFVGMSGLAVLQGNTPSPTAIGVWVLLGLGVLAWVLPLVPQRLRAIFLSPDNARIREGMALLDQGQATDAQAHFEKLSQEATDLPSLAASALFSAGVCCMRQGDFEAAQARFQAVADSKWHETWMQRANLATMLPNAEAMLLALRQDPEAADLRQRQMIKRLPIGRRAAWRAVDAVIALRRNQPEEARKRIAEVRNAAPASGQREAILTVLDGYAAFMLGEQIDLSPARRIPGSRRWLGTQWPELDMWMKQEDLA